MPLERLWSSEGWKALGQGIEEIITLVTPATFYRWLRDENEPVAKRPKGGSRKPREIRELVIEIARTPLISMKE